MMMIRNEDRHCDGDNLVIMMIIMMMRMQNDEGTVEVNVRWRSQFYRQRLTTLTLVAFASDTPARPQKATDF